MINEDLNRIMRHYRKEVKANVTKLQIKRLVAIISFIPVTVLCMQYGWFFFYSIYAGALFLAFRFGVFRLPPLAMNDAFLIELAKIDIEDKNAFERLRTSLKSKAYLLYDEVEDFIEQEVATRALNQQLNSTGAKALLEEEK